MITKNYHKSKPLHTRMRTMHQKGTAMALTHSQILHQILAHACPSTIDPVNPDNKTIAIDLHCSEAIFDVTFKGYNREQDLYDYEIHSVTIGCESMTTGCTECGTIIFNDINNEEK